MTKTRICFVADHPKNILGGAERQNFKIASLMVEKGFDVTMISQSGGGSPSEYFDSGVSVREVTRIREGGPMRDLDLVRLLTEMQKAIKEENAHVYYQRIGGVMTGLVGFECRTMNRPFIFASASYWDSNDNLNGRAKERTPLTWLRMASPIYRYGLDRTTAIVAETEEIALQFKKRFPAKDVRQIPPMSILEPSSPKKNDPPFVLYVSRLVWYRRPLLFLKVARALPEMRFVLAGFGAMEETVRDEAKKIPNLTYLGPVTPVESADLMRRASLFLNTSLVEGFPNTLLEALACRTPYVSVFDPDDVICRFGLGAHARSFDELVSSVRILLNDQAEREKIASDGDAYLRKFHDPEVIASKYAALFREKTMMDIGSPASQDN